VVHFKTRLFHLKFTFILQLPMMPMTLINQEKISVIRVICVSEKKMFHRKCR